MDYETWGECGARQQKKALAKKLTITGREARIFKGKNERSSGDNEVKGKK